MPEDAGTKALRLREELLTLAQVQDGIEMYVYDATGKNVACDVITINARVGGRLCITGKTSDTLGITFHPAPPKVVAPVVAPPARTLTEALESLTGLLQEVPEPLYKQFKDFFDTASDVRDNVALHEMVTGTMSLDNLRGRGFDVYSLVEGAVEEYAFHKLPQAVQQYAIDEEIVLPVYKPAAEVRKNVF